MLSFLWLLLVLSTGPCTEQTLNMGWMINNRKGGEMHVILSLWYRLSILGTTIGAIDLCCFHLHFYGDGSVFLRGATFFCAWDSEGTNLIPLAVEWASCQFWLFNIFYSLFIVTVCLEDGYMTQVRVRPRTFVTTPGKTCGICLGVANLFKYIPGAAGGHLCCQWGRMCLRAKPTESKKEPKIEIDAGWHPLSP
jgi:hypothetical protein